MHVFLKTISLINYKKDKGEKIKDCAVREVEEETNTKVKIIKRNCTTWHTYTRYKKFILKKTVWYKMKCIDDSKMNDTLKLIENAASSSEGWKENIKEKKPKKDEESLKNEDEVKRLIECNEDPNYDEVLKAELDAISQQEMWQIKQKLKSLKETKWNGFLLWFAHYITK